MARRTLKELMERYNSAKHYLKAVMGADKPKLAAIRRAEDSVKFYHNEMQNFGINHKITIITYKHKGKYLKIFYPDLEDAVDIQAMVIRENLKYGYELVDYQVATTGTPYKAEENPKMRILESY